MAKRFTDTEIWDDDWWIELPDSYKFFWFYLKDHCDVVGVISPRIKKFERFTDFKIDVDSAIEFLNEGKERIVKIPNGKWVIKDFVSFQNGKVIGDRSSIHRTIRKKMDEHGITPDMIGLVFNDSNK